jgi:membrane-bound lytic murein transglycosylase MltF
MITKKVLKLSLREDRETTPGRDTPVYRGATMKTLFFLAVITFCLSGPVAAEQQSPVGFANTLQEFTGDLPEIRERRLLRVLVTHSRTDFFIDQGSIRGVQADLVKALIDHLNKGIKRESDKLFAQFIPVDFNQLIPALVSGQGDIAAAFLTITPERQSQVDFISGHTMDVNEIIVTHKSHAEISNTAGLSGMSIYTLQDSSYTEHLKQLNRKLQTVSLPPVSIVEADHRLLSEDILELVNANVIDITVIDDFKGKLWAKVLPNIRLHENVIVSADRKAGWAIRQNSPELSEALKSFSRKVRRGTLLGNILFKRYFENTQWIDNPTGRQERDKLEKHIALFKKYGDRYGFDPLALAAQAFQESRLDQSKTSHRGAVGIMQLMPTTARDPKVNIPDIHKLENNIHAGTKYLDFLRNRYFANDEIDAWDQRLFAWAAYNAGPRSIIRIRQAAAANGLDPNVWFGQVEIMAARMISREPVQYVANIHKYYTAYRLVEEQDRQRQHALDNPVGNDT